MIAQILLFIVATGSLIMLFLHCNYCRKQMQHLEDHWIDYCTKLHDQHEREKNNLITALKSYTAQDFNANLVLPDKKFEEPQKEDDEFQELDELAAQDPEKFDKAIGL